MGQKNPDLDPYFETAGPWQDIHRKLRDLVLEFDVVEERKWYQPCYTVDGHNTMIISAFKDFATLNIFKGILLDDPEGLLIKQGPNTHGGRVVAFTDVAQVDDNIDALRALIAQVVHHEKAGTPLPPKPDTALPDELVEALDADPELAEAFHALTPGRQRAWCMHISGAKQSATRVSRIEKARPSILAGKGLNDR